MPTVATVSTLYRYPVKGMAGQPLVEIELGWQGFAGDRRFAFVQSANRSNFPWLTIRELPRLTLYRPELVDPVHPDSSDVVVHTPDGAALDVTDPALAEELAAARRGKPVHVMRSKRGLFDAFPVSVLSEQSVALLSEQVGRPLEPLRFRPNIVVSSRNGAAAIPENDWVGRTLTFGDDGPRIRIDMHDERCSVVNFDPRTAQRDPTVLRTVVAERAMCTGIYGSVERPGLLRVGDPVAVD